jgi:hypothetical protein
MRPGWLAIALILCAGSAHAQSAEGSAAFALGAVVGGASPLLGATQKAVLAKLFDGDRASVAKAGKIGVAVDAILCRAGNVDITAFECDLTFGAHKAHLSGRAAHELFATLAEVGVQPDGAMGTIYAGLYKLHCTIDPYELAQASGGGADCTYAKNPP